MPITRPTVTFLHERGTRDGTALVDSFSLGGGESTRKVWVPWTERYRAAWGILGYSKLARDPDTDEITGLERLTPLPHPDAQPGGTEGEGPGNLFASKIASIKGYKAQAGTSSTLDEPLAEGASRNVFTRAEIEIEYSNPKYTVREDDEVTYEYERFVEVLEPTPNGTYTTMPGGCLRFQKSGGGTPDGKIINFNFGRVFPTTAFKLVWHRLPFDLFDPSNQTKWAKRIFGDPDDATALPLLGTVNKSAFLGFAPGTLLLEQVKPIPVVAPTMNIQEWNFEFTLHCKPSGWNMLYYPGTPGSLDGRGFHFVGATGYYAPGSVPDHESLYCEREFGTLFNVADNP